ncbi:MAG TPA: hypothetical protein VKB49_07465 [Candidatus Sulfotelmatobacter sp.]|nr:hypothetical protein [Candidatus Sulfotelmatobacter sp.]
MRKLISGLAVSLSLVVLVGFAVAQKKAEPSDSQYIAQALSAAPKSIAKGAAVVRMDESGKMATLRAGKNGFSCMVVSGNKMCADANSMAFFDAWMKHQAPPEKLGLTYMLAGDDGASNTDPYATAKSADNHWVVTGPHVMIVGPAAKSLGLASAADADSSSPYMMWAGTPYEHAMIPVAPPKASAKPAAAAQGATKK